MKFGIDFPRTIITSLLRRLPSLFSGLKNPEPALLPTLESALSSLTATGGKIVCSLATLPTWGPGRLFLRDKNDLHGLESEKKLFQTEHPGWRKLAGKLVENGVGVDFFIAAAGGKYMDIATIGEVIEQSFSAAIPNVSHRTCRCNIWRRDVFLPEFYCPSRLSAAVTRGQAHSDARNRISSADESSMLEWPTGIIVSWQLPTAYVRRRP